MKQKYSFGMLLDSLVSISSFNQGKAAKIINELKSDDFKIIVKNNEPMAALVSVDRFNQLCEAESKLAELERKNHEK